MNVVWKLPLKLAENFREMEQEAYSNLVAGDYEQAEKIYKKQYEIFLIEEEKLPKDKKFHKGGPLHNQGISLLLQQKILTGFQLITLAYIEDLLNSKNLESAFGATAYRTLRSYPLISKEFLDKLKELATNRRRQDKIPRDPSELIQEYREAGYADLTQSLKEEKVISNPINIEQLKPQIQNQLKELGPEKKRVFIGGSYRNIALLRYIAQIVQNLDDYKAILPIDLPRLSSDNYDSLTHDVSMEYLSGCSFAIFDVSISDGHLMEIEKARIIKNLEDVLLVFQQRKASEKPIITKMVLTINFRKEPYKDFEELKKIIEEFLK